MVYGYIALFQVKEDNRHLILLQYLPLTSLVVALLTAGISSYVDLRCWHDNIGLEKRNNKICLLQMEWRTVEIRDENGKGFDTVQYEDVVLPKQFVHIQPETRMKAISELKYRDGDILLCSYPKTGKAVNTGQCLRSGRLVKCPLRLTSIIKWTLRSPP